MQYQQAVTALETARRLTDDDGLTVDDAGACLQRLKTQESEQTDRVLSLKHKRDLASATANQFEQGLSLLQRIDPSVGRNEAGTKAKHWVEQGRTHRYLADSLSQRQYEQRELTQRVEQQQKASQLVSDYQALTGEHLADSDAVEQAVALQQEKRESLQQEKETQAERLRELARTEEAIDAEIRDLESKAPRWFAANEALTKLESQTEKNIGR